MAGTLRVKNLQLGDNATATQNFVWTENSDGTAKLARGNVGATTQDILTVDANGRVALTQNQVYFRANQGTGQTVAASTPTVPNFTNAVEDVGGYYNTTTRRYTPLVAGLYGVAANCNLAGSTTTGRLVVRLYKSANIIVTNNSAAFTTANTNFVAATAFAYMNGTTDYFEVSVNCEGSGTLTLNALSENGFSAYLIAKA